MKAPRSGTLACAAALALACGLLSRTASAAAASPTLEPLVPAVAAHPYRLAPGVRPYERRVSVSPAFGTFGSDRMFAVMAAYNPEPWLAWEASLSHTPGRSVHAVMHTLTAIVRRPLPGRFQPYLSAGYGMVIVNPGQAVNAIAVTKNALAAGGGMEMYVRDDLALRVDVRHATVFGTQRDREGLVAYPYLQGTLGLTFYRSIQP